ncbi:hypothetical protein JXB31_00070 [Candidatus Woesearchaeota archaeon]|nr:hypothetical protein [Candidatus Woesearchaeota archaeon]
MTIIGFNFTSIKAERSNPIKGKIGVQNSVKIEDIKESDLIVGSNKNKTMIFEFIYTSKYSPNIGEITLKGSLVMMADPKKVVEVVTAWKSGKKEEKNLPKDVMAPVINTVLNKCSIMALQMTREVNLPPQIQLPKVKVN